jgi:hypothetical protein
MTMGFSCYETIGIGIPNPRTVTQISGPPEALEKIAHVYDRLYSFCEENMIETSELRPEEMLLILDIVYEGI